MPPKTRAAPVQYEILSNQAMAFLRRKGYSETFITGLYSMLREAGSVHRRTEIKPPKSSQPFEWSPGRPSVVKPEMPSELSYCVREYTEKGRKIMMPDIGPYAPTKTYHTSTYRAFESREGQRFMRQYYITGWLRKDSSTGEWVVRPPLSAVPRKTR